MKLYPSILMVLVLPTSPLCGWQNEVTTLKPGPFLKKLKPVHLSFELNWDGKINSGNLNLLFDRKDPRYPHYVITQIYGGSTGVAKGLFPYDCSFTSFLRKDDLRPAMFAAIETNSDERRETNNWYRSTVISKEITTPHRKGKAPKTKKSTFPFSKAPVYDLASAFLYIRSLDLKVGQEMVMVLHPFASPYLARIKVLRREIHRGLKCLRMDLKLQKIGPGGNLLGYDKMKTTTMWFSDDHERLPVELRSKVFIGDVRAVLVGKKYL